MDVLDPEQDARLSAVAEILRCERPALRPDEVERVQRRLSRCWAPRRVGMPRSRLLVAVCLAFGILLMSAGTGLAISGFATPGAAVEARYPHGPLNTHATIMQVRVRQAQTRVDLPFSGLQALPILAAGMALFVTGGMLDRRTAAARPGGHAVTR